MFDVDKILSKLKTFNRWRLMKYNLICISFNMSGLWQMMAVVFTGAEPKHYCKLPEHINKSNAIPMEYNHGKYEYSQCKMYENFSFILNNKTVNCVNGWEYDESIGETIVTEWNLVCEKNYYVETSQAVFVIGVLLGALLFPTLSDMIGRKKVHLGCQWAMILVGTLTGLVPTFESYTALKLINGALREGAGLTGIVWSCELWQSEFRSIAGVGIQLYWSIAWFLLALLAYLIRDWRRLQIAISLINVFTIALFWFLPESILWLTANNKEKDAKKLLIIAAESEGKSEEDVDEWLQEQGVQISLNVEDGIVQNHNSPSKFKKIHCPKMSNMSKICRRKKTPPSDDVKKYTLIDILKSRRLLLYASISCSLWAVNSLVYHGLSLLVSSLAGNIYLNFFFSGLVEVPAYVLCMFLLQRFGRRKPLVIHQMMTGAFLLIATFIPEKTAGGADLSFVIIACTLIGKYAVTFTFAEIVLYSQEFFPTNMRNAGLGISSLFARIFGVLATYSTYVVKYFPWFPGVVFGSLSLIIGLLSLLLPETADKPLPNTIEDIENWGTKNPLPNTIEDIENWGTKNPSTCPDTELQESFLPKVDNEMDETRT